MDEDDEMAEEEADVAQESGTNAQCVLVFGGTDDSRHDVCVQLASKSGGTLVTATDLISHSERSSSPGSPRSGLVSFDDQLAAFATLMLMQPPPYVLDAIPRMPSQLPKLEKVMGPLLIAIAAPGSPDDEAKVKANSQYHSRLLDRVHWMNILDEPAFDAALAAMKAAGIVLNEPSTVEDESSTAAAANPPRLIPAKTASETDLWAAAAAAFQEENERAATKLQAVRRGVNARRSLVIQKVAKAEEEDDLWAAAAAAAQEERNAAQAAEEEAAAKVAKDEAAAKAIEQAAIEQEAIEQAVIEQAAIEQAAIEQAAAKEAAAKEAAAGAVSSYAASKPLSADGVLILPSGVSDPLGVDQRKLGVTVWLTEDEGVAGRWGRATWRRPDLRVRIERIDATAKTFDATAVPPGRFAVSKLPLDQCATVQLSGRELRAYEQSAKRDQLRQENADDEAKIRAERIARLGAEEVDAREAAEAARRAVALKRSAREREALKVWSPDDGDADASSSAYPLVVHNRINMSNRMSDTDLPDDLMADPEAVDVWHAAIAMKRRKGAGSLDQWVHGWRMRLVPRQTVSGYDLYIRAPDMRPETMPSKHMSSKDAIRSFSNLLEKLRERLASGASSGASAGAPPLHAVCYYAPHLGRVVLELHVTPTAPSADGDGGAAPSVPSEVHQEVEVPMEVS